MAETTSDDGQTSSVVTRRRDVYLTLVNLGCVYFLINVSYSGLETLQSTVNAEQGLGTTSVGVLYAALIASSLLVGPTVVDRLRAKRALYVAWAANAVFAVANAFPRWETLLPASAFVGVTMASGNIVYGLYVTALADQLSALADNDGQCWHSPYWCLFTGRQYRRRYRCSKCVRSKYRIVLYGVMIFFCFFFQTSPCSLMSCSIYTRESVNILMRD